jgi:uncharacterized protein (DUF2147 family)
VKTGKTYSGKIIWLKTPNYVPADAAPGGADTDVPPGKWGQMLGKPKFDWRNPDAAKRSRALLGVPLLNGFTYSGDDVWEGGTIYNPDDGKTYKCKMTLNGNRLDVRGFIGISLFGKTTTWTRAK